MKIIKPLTDFLRKHNRVKIIDDRVSNAIYMERYYLLFVNRPRWFPFNITLHNLLKSDPDGLHDHPWSYFTIVLKGGYWEETLDGNYWRGPGHFRFRSAKTFHRLSIDNKPNNDQTWTLFFMGPRQKEWGFLNKQGSWIHWDTYLNK